MKRILALTVVILLLSGLCLADSLDYSDISFDGATDDELFAMRFRIEQLLIDRGYSDADIIECGVYTVGEDIKPGIALFYSIEDYYTEIYLYEDMEHRKKDDRILWHSLRSDREGPYRLLMSNGNILVIHKHYGICKFQEEPKSWAP